MVLHKILGRKKSKDIATADMKMVKDHIEHLSSGLTAYQQYLHQWSYHVNNHIQHLHHRHASLQDAHSNHKTAHKDHKSELKELKGDVAEHQKVVRQYESSLSKMTNKLETLKSSLFDRIANNNQQISDLHKEVAHLKRELSASHTDNQRLKEQMAQIVQYQQDLADQVKAVENRPIQVHKIKETVTKKAPESPKAPQSSHSHISATLTPSEKKVLALLVTAKDPVTYKDLAEDSNKSPATIKTQLNALRNKGVPVQDLTDPAGQKRFFVSEELKRAV